MRWSRGKKSGAIMATVSTSLLVFAMVLVSSTAVWAQAASETMVTSGGTLAFAGGAVTMSAPDGAVTSDMTASYTPLDAGTAPAAAPEGMAFGSQVFSLAVSLDGVDQPAFAFRQLVSVTVAYTDEDLAVAKGGRDDSISLYLYDSVGSSWLRLDAAIPDVVNNTITASITGPVTLALVVTPEPAPEPTAEPTTEPTATPVATATPAVVPPETGDIAPWSGLALALAAMGAALVLGGGYVVVRGGLRGR